MTLGAVAFVGYAVTRIETGDVVNTYARSTFEDPRCKAAKFGAHGNPP
jgi:hypothetical protein